MDKGQTLHDMPAIVAAVSGIAISLSIARELGFWWQIDTNLMRLMSLQDFFVNSLPFVPFILFLWGVSIYLSSFGIQPKPGGKLHNFIHSTGNPGKEIRMITFLTILGLLFFANWPLLVAFNSILVFWAAIAWIRKAGGAPMTSFGFEMLVGIFFLVQTFAFGAMDGQFALSVNNADYVIETESRGEITLQILRSGTEYVIAIDEEKVIHAIRQDSISSIRYVSSEPSAMIGLGRIFEGLSDWLDD